MAHISKAFWQGFAHWGSARVCNRELSVAQKMLAKSSHREGVLTGGEETWFYGGSQWKSLFLLNWFSGLSSNVNAREPQRCSFAGPSNTEALSEEADMHLSLTWTEDLSLLRAVTCTLPRWRMAAKTWNTSIWKFCWKPGNKNSLLLGTAALLFLPSG